MLERETNKGWPSSEGKRAKVLEDHPGQKILYQNPFLFQWFQNSERKDWWTNCILINLILIPSLNKQKWVKFKKIKSPFSWYLKETLGYVSGGKQREKPLTWEILYGPLTTQCCNLVTQNERAYHTSAPTRHLMKLTGLLVESRNYPYVKNDRATPKCLCYVTRVLQIIFLNIWSKIHLLKACKKVRNFYNILNFIPKRNAKEDSSGWN